MFKINSMKPMDSTGVVNKRITMYTVWTGRLPVDVIG
jgi:hypothetical protein